MNETNMNRAKFYQLALFPMNNGATNVYFVLILSYVATFGENILGLVGFASIMVTMMRLFDAITDPIIGALKARPTLIRILPSTQLPCLWRPGS